MLEDNLPAHQGSITLEQSKNWAFTWRLNYYGEVYEDHLDASAGMDIYGDVNHIRCPSCMENCLKPVALTANLFDSLPNENPFQGEVGALTTYIA